MPEGTEDAIVERARAQLGKVLKQKYRLDGLLGVGGMASVFSATHRNGNRVAVKLLHPELMLNKEALVRFLREGYAANKVEHRGTVRVLDDDNDNGAAFLVMELLEGETVQELSERSGGALDPAKVLALAHQVLDVLAAAHDKGIVHRDIKPENLFLTRDGTLKVLDFGIARVRESTAGVTVTKTGNPFGSPAYMAPEQALGRSREVDARTDIYAVGATMFTLLSGELVHEAESAHEMVIIAATKPARSLGVVMPGARRELVDLVDRALSFESRARWPDARSMQQAIRETHQSLYGVALPDSPTLAGDGLGPSRTGAFSPSSTADTQLGAPVRPPLQEAMTAPPTSTGAPSPRTVRRRWPIAAVSAATLVVFAMVGIGFRMTTSSTPSAVATSGPSASPPSATNDAPPPPSASVVETASAPSGTALGSTPAAPSPPVTATATVPRSAAPAPRPRPPVPARPPPKPDPYGAR
jgi:serine/threonine protein kinase